MAILSGVTQALFFLYCIGIVKRPQRNHQRSLQTLKTIDVDFILSLNKQENLTLLRRAVPKFHPIFWAAQKIP